MANDIGGSANPKRPVRGGRTPDAGKPGKKPTNVTGRTPVTKPRAPAASAPRPRTDLTGPSTWGNPDNPAYGNNLITVNVQGLSFTVNKLVAPNFVGFINALIKIGYRPRQVQSYNNRNIAGTSTKSTHAFGASIDIDPDTNPQFTNGKAGRHGLPNGVSALARSYGLGWGGDFNTSKDYMHFEALGSPGAKGSPKGGSAPVMALPSDADLSGLPKGFKPMGTTLTGTPSQGGAPGSAPQGGTAAPGPLPGVSGRQAGPAPTSTQIINGTAPLPGFGTGADGAYRMQDYGFSNAFFTSDPELKKLVDRAVQDQYTPERFAVELKSTKWFRARTASEREWTALTTADPKSANRQVEIRTEEVRRQAVASGAVMSVIEIKQLATTSLRFGYSDAEVQQAVAKKIKANAGNDFSGQAGQNQDTIKATAASFGVTMAGDQIARWVQDLATGVRTDQDFDNWVKATAKLMYPGLAAQIDQGLTVADVAGLYRKQYADVLEVNEADIDITKDPAIKRALSYRDPKGKADQPGVMPLYQFEAELKNDPRWLRTNNARDSLMGVAGEVLRGFGFKT